MIVWRVSHFVTETEHWACYLIFHSFKIMREKKTHTRQIETAVNLVASYDKWLKTPAEYSRLMEKNACKDNV